MKGVTVYMDVRSRSYNALWQENNHLYEQWARAHGLSYNELLILISLVDSDNGCSQKDVSRQWMIPKQTVHSILKNMVRQKLVFLESSIADKRSKHIRFTDEGRRFAEQITGELFRLEQKIWDRLGTEQTKALLHGLSLCNQFMKEEIALEHT